MESLFTTTKEISEETLTPLSYHWQKTKAIALRD
jgi:hypothetical protein